MRLKKAIALSGVLLLSALFAQSCDRSVACYTISATERIRAEFDSLVGDSRKRSEVPLSKSACWTLVEDQNSLSSITRRVHRCVDWDPERDGPTWSCDLNPAAKALLREIRSPLYRLTRTLLETCGNSAQWGQPLPESTQTQLRLLESEITPRVEKLKAELKCRIQ